MKRIIRALRADRDAWVKKRRGDVVASGEPDIEHIAFGHVTMLEVKLEGRDPTPLQRRVMAKLARAGATVAVVRSVEAAFAVVGDASVANTQKRI